MRRKPEHIKSFFALYGLMLGVFDLRSDAYEAAEAKWFDMSGARFYKNYNSFCASQNHFRKSNRMSKLRKKLRIES